MVREGAPELRNWHQIKVHALTAVWRHRLKRNPINMLSVDTGGFEMQVLRGLDYSLVQPGLIICETSRPGGESRVNEVAEFLKSRGYKQIKRLGCNAVYEHRGVA